MKLGRALQWLHSHYGKVRRLLFVVVAAAALVAVLVPCTLLSFYLSGCFSGHLSQRHEDLHSCKNMHMDIYNSFIHSGPKQ